MGCAQSTAAHGVEDPQPEVQQITPAVEPIVQPQHLAALAPSAALKVSKITVSPDIDKKLDLSDIPVYKLNMPKPQKKVDHTEEETLQKKGFSRSEEDLMADIANTP